MFFNFEVSYLLSSASKIIFWNVEEELEYLKFKKKTTKTQKYSEMGVHSRETHRKARIRAELSPMKWEVTNVKFKGKWLKNAVLQD